MERKIYTKESYISNQIGFFKAQSKEAPKLLGMEFEHFLVDQHTLRSYDYFEPNGQKNLFEKLLKKDWTVLQKEDGNLLGIQKDGHTLTLEPGGQVEISLKAFVSLSEIDKAYQSVLKDISQVMVKGQAMVSIGYHPLSKIADLPLLPKKRYAMMYDYFKTNGLYCHNMMKGTAATQISIDFRSEEDFIRKFRVANFLSPVLASLFDATPIFEGALIDFENCRMKIWDQTDIKRSKLIPGSLDKTFGFGDYAEYLLALPPILMVVEGQVVFTGNVPLTDLLPEHPLSLNELEHLQTMVFPDVRLKRYIEIRMPDAMPYPYSMAVAAIVKGIFYNEKQLSYFYTLSLNKDDAWVKSINRQLIGNTMSQETNNFNTLKWDVLNGAIQGLDKEEAKVIHELINVINEHSSLTSYLRKLYLKDFNQFVRVITVAEHQKTVEE